AHLNESAKLKPVIQFPGILAPASSLTPQNLPLICRKPSESLFAVSNFSTSFFLIEPNIIFDREIRFPTHHNSGEWPVFPNTLGIGHQEAVLFELLRNLTSNHSEKMLSK